MKVLHINTYDTGGAATACLRIHKSLLEQGIDSKVLVLNKTKDIEGLYSFDYWLGTKSFFHYLVKKLKLIKYNICSKNLNKKLPHSSVPFSFPNTVFDITEHPLYKEADIIQLNWTAGFLDEPSFFAKNTKPVIWRMADLYVCGGGNHYELDFPFQSYKRYIEKNIKIREKALVGKKIFLVPISEWVKSKAEESSIVGKYKSKVIHNGLDLNIFQPFNQSFSRKVWNIPADKKVILIGSANNKEPRKGYSTMLKAIELLNRSDIHFCSFGKTDINSPHIQNLGKIDNERVLATIYSSVDLFVMTSLEEAFGQVTIESLVCGTPVVSFPNGGSKDIIINGQNGFLTEDFSVNSLAQAIIKAIDYPFDREFIVKDTSERFNIANKANEYISLYQQILEA